MSNKIRSPVIYASHYSYPQGFTKPADCIDTIRLFLDNLDFSYDYYSDGWLFIRNLLYRRIFLPNESCAHTDDNERNAVTIWSLRMLAPDIKNNFVEISAAKLLQWALHFDVMDVFDFVLKILDSLIDARTEPDGYSTLLYSFHCKHSYLRDGGYLNKLLTRGADPHLIGFKEESSPRKETPTSLAMYSSRAFVTWRNALLQISTDLELFVRKELQQSPLEQAGWHENSLLSLFQSQIHPQIYPEVPSPCDMCGKPLDGLRWWRLVESRLIVELRWCRWLDSIKEV